MASYLLGLPNSALRNIGDTAAIMRKHDYSGFVQDDWKVSTRLTLNLGFRYDYLGWPVSRDNTLGSFDLDHRTVSVGREESGHRRRAECAPRHRQPAIQ